MLKRALVYDRYGPPEVLRIEEVEVPAVGPGEVRVRVVASSLNDWDRDLLRGEPLNRAIAPRRPRYRVLGADAAGVVVDVSGDVTAFSPGDEVMADLSPHGFGGFAEYAVAPAPAWRALPAGLTMAQAAAVPQAGSLAMAGLRAAQPLTPGRRVAVNGAGGGVGTFALQIAKAAGAHVTAIDVGPKLEALRALGADEVIDYRAEDFTRRAGRYDAIVEISAHHRARDYRRALRAGGMCSVIGGQKRMMLSVLTVGTVQSAVGDRRVRMALWRANDRRDSDRLDRMLESREVAPVIDSEITLDQVPGALERFGAQRHVGKIVVRL